MTTIIIPTIIVTTIIVIIYNNIVHLKNTIKNSKALIDVYLQQRFDLIPNLVEVTKGYMKHENDVLSRIASLRASYNANKDISTGMSLNNEYANILGIIESHPELKANENFLKLQKALDKVESQLQAARRIYNMDVTKYNTRITIVPFNIFAIIFGFKEEKLFEAEKDARTNVKV